MSIRFGKISAKLSATNKRSRRIRESEFTRLDPAWNFSGACTWIHLKAHFEAFCEHARIADIMALCAAFDLLERGWHEPATCTRQQAAFLESFLAILGFGPTVLLESEWQKRPDWPL